MNSIRNRHQIIGMFVIFSIAVSLTMFSGWETTWETWGYWLFSRILGESGQFIITDRSSLYTVYLLPFRLLPFPYSVATEYFVTMMLTAVALFFLLRLFMSYWPSVFAAVCWLPFFQISEPSVQLLALSFSAFGLIYREKGRFNFSYACFLIAYLFRTTYILFPLVFLMFDLYRMIHDREWPLIRKALMPTIIWPVILVLTMFTTFRILQSDSPWNNAWAVSSRWFPVKGKSLAEASIIQYINWSYILKKYGATKGRDFYYTNQELFGDASTLGEAFRANPSAIFDHLLQNALDFPTAATAASILGRQDIEKANALGKLLLFSVLFASAFALVYAKPDYKLFVVASLGLVLVTILSRPSARYMVPLAPIFSMAAVYLARRAATKVWLLRSMTVLFLIVLSPAYMWATVARELRQQSKDGEVRVLESATYSMKKAVLDIAPMIGGCSGLIALEHAAIGAFTDYPLEKLHDVFEIPPFGQLGGADYDGLKPDKINCIFLSHIARFASGDATNHDSRVSHYILPYAMSIESQSLEYSIPVVDGLLWIPKH